MLGNPQSNKAGEIIEQHGRLASARSGHERLWREVATRIMPSELQHFNSSAHGNLNPGDAKTNEMLDATGTVALGRFAAIMDSLLTPRNSTWHRVMASVPELQKARRVALWFEEANRLLFKYRYAPKANFASQNYQNFEKLGALGTGCMFTDALATDKGLRYKSIHLSEVYFTENHQGIVDGAVRYFHLEARQAVQKWGEKLPESIKKAATTSPYQLFPFIHAVETNENLDPKRADYKGMAYSSFYVSVEGRAMLEEGGYRTFPYSVSRYKQATNEIYGRSPAMEVLPALKSLNEMKRVVLKQGQRIVDPVILTHDDGIADTFSMRSGAINSGAVSAEGRLLVQTLPTGNVNVGKELMDDEKAVVNDAFLVNLFQIVTDSAQMTATEVLERTKEKGILMAPTVGRQQSEYLGTLLERELDILMNQGLLPPLPPELIEAKGDYRIEYDSPISRAQRAEEASGLMRTVEHALQVVNITGDKAPLDMFNWDVIMPKVAEINGVPLAWLNAPEDIMRIRQGRAEQQETQEMIQGAPAAAAMVKAAAVAQKQ